jgi:hypothetical protein
VRTDTKVELQRARAGEHATSEHASKVGERAAAMGGEAVTVGGAFRWSEAMDDGERSSTSAGRPRFMGQSGRRCSPACRVEESLDGEGRGEDGGDKMIGLKNHSAWVRLLIVIARLY